MYLSKLVGKKFEKVLRKYEKEREILAGILTHDV
jgi:hypothetical protein